jgi:predicted TIM-barrel fold metal-dependent hydrolase
MCSDGERKTAAASCFHLLSSLPGSEQRRRRDVGIERVMLGSDYCFDMGYTHAVDIVDKLALDEAQRTPVLRGTAARLLKI